MVTRTREATEAQGPSRLAGDVTVRGFGLHGGRPSRVIFSPRLGPVVLSTTDGESPIHSLEVASTDRATTVRAAGSSLRVATVEHLFAAFAAFRVYEGLTIRIEGDEVPLLGGGAHEWCVALQDLGLRPSAPPLRVLQDGTVEVGESRYTFACHPEVSVVARIDFGDPRIAPEAAWNGDPNDFATRIAPARTFAFARDLEAMAAQGLASHVAPESVVLFTPDTVLSAGRPFSADEPARHKLLDLIGDLYLYGGPPIGRIVAVRPGHAATHAAVRVAFERGLVA
jgi:UDP-3-O-[3-hydroxymyristoyl] N-acetylglucosamine deacetylase